MAELAPEKHRRGSGLHDDPLGQLRSATRCLCYRTELQHTNAGAATMLHCFDNRDLVADTGVREGVVSMESNDRGNWIECVTGRD